MLQAIALSPPDVAGRALCLRALYPLVEQGASEVWIHIAYEGTWEGHEAGAFTLDRKSFDQIVVNFDRQANPIPLDYEHATEWATKAPAAGWVQEIQVRTTDGSAHLWARVELTTEAAGHIREGAYRFSSGVFVFDATDRVSGDDCGCVMHSLALTNTPFVDGQEPIRLSQRAALATGADMKIDKAELIAKLNELEGDELSPEAVAKLAEALALLAEAAADKPPDEPEVPAAEVAPASDAPEEAVVATDAPPTGEPVPDTVALQFEEEGEVPPEDQTSDAGAMAMALLMETLGLDEAGVLAFLEANRDALAGLGGATEEPAPLDAALSEQVSTLSEDVDARDTMIRDLHEKLTKYIDAEQVAAQITAEAEVTELVDAGRLAASQRDWAIKKCKAGGEDWTGVKALLSPVVPTGRHASATNQPISRNGSTPEVADDDPRIEMYVLALDGTHKRDDATGERRLITRPEKVALAKQRLAQLN